MCKKTPETVSLEQCYVLALVYTLAFEQEGNGKKKHSRESWLFPKTQISGLPFLCVQLPKPCAALQGFRVMRCHWWDIFQNGMFRIV